MHFTRYTEMGMDYIQMNGDGKPKEQLCFEDVHWASLISEVRQRKEPSYDNSAMHLFNRLIDVKLKKNKQLIPTELGRLVM